MRNFSIRVESRERNCEDWITVEHRRHQDGTAPTSDFWAHETSSLRSFGQWPLYHGGHHSVEHAPLISWLAENVDSRRILALGAYLETAYFGLCQTIKFLGLDAQCQAFGVWRDAEGGNSVPQRVLEHNEVNYSEFSSISALMSPDQARTLCGQAPTVAFISLSNHEAPEFELGSVLAALRHAETLVLINTPSDVVADAAMSLWDLHYEPASLVRVQAKRSSLLIGYTAPTPPARLEQLFQTNPNSRLAPQHLVQPFVTFGERNLLLLGIGGSGSAVPSSHDPRSGRPAVFHSVVSIAEHERRNLVKVYEERISALQSRLADSIAAREDLERRFRAVPTDAVRGLSLARQRANDAEAAVVIERESRFSETAILTSMVEAKDLEVQSLSQQVEDLEMTQLGLQGELRRQVARTDELTKDLRDQEQEYAQRLESLTERKSELYQGKAELHVKFRTQSAQLRALKAKVVAQSQQIQEARAETEAISRLAASASQEAARLSDNLRSLRASRSWRLTGPLRSLTRMFH